MFPESSEVGAPVCVCVGVCILLSVCVALQICIEDQFEAIMYMYDLFCLMSAALSVCHMY